MIFIILAAVLAAISSIYIGTILAVWLLATSQLLLLVREIIKGQISGTGGFMFMSFTFFAVRPIYIATENDYFLFTNLFGLQVGLDQLTVSMWWATLASLSFAFGCLAAPIVYKYFGINRRLPKYIFSGQSLSPRKVNILLTLQVLSLFVMAYLASSGRSLYGSAMGAYVYDLPVPLQAIHIVSLVSLFDRYRFRRSLANLIKLFLSVILFLYFTWLMREVTIFRGFYVFGVMIGFLAIMLRIKLKVSLLWIILPILLLQPFFQTLGQTRFLDNSTFTEEKPFESVSIRTYWDFYDSRGDINIFDTFVAAQLSKPEYLPYAMSWIYPPFHIIPRALWRGKPEKGILQDISFTNGAPYSPGIVGFFLLDGGAIWMLFSMFILGIVLAALDAYSFRMLNGIFQSCVIAILVVNGMFLTRTFLWFYFWQVIYAVYPVYLICQRFAKSNKHKAGLHEHNIRHSSSY